MRVSSAVALSLLAILPRVGAGQSKLPVQQAIEAQFPLTKPTADHTDIVTAGAVIDLLKDNLEMNQVTAKSECKDTYKGGKFESSFLCKMQRSNPASGYGGIPQGTNRMFVAQEKFWLIKVDVQDKAAVLEFISDPISDVRYRALVTYPFPSGGFPTPDVVLAQIKETIKAESVDGKDEKKDQPSAQVVPPPPPPTQLADIPPPLPPPDAPPAEPPTMKIGLTKDQVIAMFGKPTQIINKGTSELDIYPDMKVTYVKGKVSNIQ